MGTKDRILAIIRQKGPVIPVHVSREINTSILMASALLSELVKNKQVLISTIKIGSSPLYYTTGQEQKLQQYSNHLSAREREAYELIKQKLVLQDSKQQPVTRAALRQIRDFAKPIEVTIEGKNELFWKWYLASATDVEKQVKETLGVKEPRSPQPEKPKSEPVPKPEILKEQPKPTFKRGPEPKEPKPKLKPEPKPKLQFVDKTVEDEFLSKVVWYFKKSEIEIIEKNVIRKKSEIDFIIKIPSPVGTLKYYCKARNKAKINDRDLSSAYVQGQMKKLPVLFIYASDITKKAREMLYREFENMTLKKI